jgi:hypothetical protein
MATRDFPTARKDPPRKALTQGGRGSDVLLSDAEAGANGKAIDALVQALGGRPALLDTLAVAADAPEVEHIVSLLIDPRYDKVSLRQLCHMAGLTVVDLFAAVKKAMITKAHLIAYKAITEALVPVVEDVMKRAAPYEITCYGCGGDGEVQDPEQPQVVALITCPQCAGRGTLVQLPDLDRQKLALELAQLVQKAGGLNIQQNTLNVQPGGSDGPKVGGTLVELQHAVRELLSGPRTPLPDPETVPVVEGTIADEDEADPAVGETIQAAREPVRGPSVDPIPPLGGAF